MPAVKVINDETDRLTILKWVVNAPLGTRVTFQRSKRTLPQNSKLWACLTDVAEQVEWHGARLKAADWKDLFTASLRKARVVPGLDEGTFVLLGLHTSDMDKAELADLIDLIYRFGADHGVVFNDHETQAAEAAA